MKSANGHVSTLTGNQDTSQARTDEHVANVEPEGKAENYQLTNKGELLEQLIEAGEYS